MADDDFNNNKSNYTIVTVLELDGLLTIEMLKKSVHTALALQVGKSKQNFRYWKLRQYPVNIMGYWFWKNEDHFSVDDHVKRIDYKYFMGDLEYDSTAMAKLHMKILHKTFPIYKSPWDITLITNVPKTNQEKSLVALRLHHCLGDGKSVTKLIVEGLGGSKEQTALSSRPEMKNNTIISKVKSFINAALKLYPNVVDINVKAYVTKVCTEEHPWRVNNFKKDKSPFVLRFSKTIQLSKLKSICENFNKKVSPSAIILTAITEAVRKFLENTKFENDPIFMLSTLPKSDHPNTLTNHFEWGTLILQNESDASTLLEKTHKTYISIRDDQSAHISMQIYQYAVSTFIKPIREILPQNGLFLTAVSNFAGNDAEFSIENLPCANFSLSVGQPRASVGVMFTIFSYKKSIQFCVMSRENILTEIECEYMTHLLEDQIDHVTKISTSPTTC